MTTTATVQGEFPSPRGVELHKPSPALPKAMTNCPTRFRPLAGLSCINLMYLGAALAEINSGFRPLAGLSCINRLSSASYLKIATWFPSPRGVELHKPREDGTADAQMIASFRPLAGLSCINLCTFSRVFSLVTLCFRPLAGLSCINHAYQRKSHGICE